MRLRSATVSSTSAPIVEARKPSRRTTTVVERLMQAGAAVLEGKRKRKPSSRRSFSPTPGEKAAFKDVASLSSESDDESIVANSEIRHVVDEMDVDEQSHQHLPRQLQQPSQPPTNTADAETQTQCVPPAAVPSQQVERRFFCLCPPFDFFFF